MQRFEYKVVPAPKRGEKARGVKTTEDRFAHGLTLMMNDLGRDGWEYIRADTLPCEERVGLTGRTTTFQHMLVFRRTIADAQRAPVPGPAVAQTALAEPAALPEPDLMDEAARRNSVITNGAAPAISRPAFGTSPRLSSVSETGQAPALGPARGTGGTDGSGHAAE